MRLQSLNSGFIDPDAPAHWRQRIEISGLNILTLGIYVEVLQHWFGDITGVFARGKILQPSRQDYEVIIPDVLTVLCSFRQWNGRRARIQRSRCARPGGSSRGLRRPRDADLRFRMRMWCTPGQIGDRALHVVELTPDLETNWHVEDDFIAAVKSRGRIRPHPDFEDGLRYMRVVQAVADSRARNEWVAIEPATNEGKPERRASLSSLSSRAA